jgi:hypothetical protein
VAISLTWTVTAPWRDGRFRPKRTCDDDAQERHFASATSALATIIFRMSFPLVVACGGGAGPTKQGEAPRLTDQPSGRRKGALGATRCLAWRGVILYPHSACAWASLCWFSIIPDRREEGPRMANVVVVGAQWGDEGKGKIVDLLAQQSDVAARAGGVLDADRHVREVDSHRAGHVVRIRVFDIETHRLVREEKP